MKITICDHCGEDITTENPSSFLRVTRGAGKINLFDLDLCPNCYNELLEKCERFIDECYQKKFFGYQKEKRN